MTTNPAPVRIRRDAPARFTAINGRGAEIRIGRSQDGADFSPVELLMAALGACAGLSADHVISRRIGEDAPIDVVVEADKDLDADRVTAVRTRFELDLGTLSPADQETLVKLVNRAVERTCTVSRSVEPGTPVELSIAAR
ncbi:OsmC family protein [Actinocrispum sp. NPDC049592]|uniref:OsmC family protein n=1 Tax=Actinocrispum sp. NPDC049592 TaxID=3154835 RepID=UPI003439DA9F